MAAIGMNHQRFYPTEAEICACRNDREKQSLLSWHKRLNEYKAFVETYGHGKKYFSPLCRFQ